MNRVYPSFILAVSIISVLAINVYADVPYPKAPEGADVYAYEGYCYLETSAGVPVLPENYTCDDSEWKYSSNQSGNIWIDNSPKELYGVTGMSVDRAWEITTGRPDVIIAIIDSGIKWDEKNITNKFYLNKGELIAPRDLGGECIPYDEGSNPLAYWDCNGDGVFNVEDYEGLVSDNNGNGFIDPEDIIIAFSDGADNDGNGYVDDICGWDMVDDDNDPCDDVRYGHGTGESEDSCGEAYSDRENGFPGTCPNCRILPVRVGLSFMADDMDFGRAVIFAVDSDATIIQEALGTINGSRLAQDALDYAYYKGVPVIASAADEESFHQNLPAAHEHTITVNSVTKYEDGMYPESYLYLNGCTNYGGKTDVAVSSTSCSSEATGRGAGVAGLIVSAAKNENLDPFLNANEIKQIITMSADDIDFSGNYWSFFPLFQTRRFHSGPGWDQYFGYGRVNAKKAVGMVRDGEIPPEADITRPGWFETLDPRKTPEVDIVGSVAARRAETYSYRLEYGYGIQPKPDEWKNVTPEPVTLDHPIIDDVLCSWDISDIKCPTSPPQGLDDFTVTLRLVVTDNNGNEGECRKTLYIHHDPDLKQGFPIALHSSGEAAVIMVDLDGDNIDEMVVSTTDGIIYALRSDGTNIEGWPVHTDLLKYRYEGSDAYKDGIDNRIYEGIAYGGVAIGDLDRDGDPEVVAATLCGKVYVWEHDGTPRKGFPVSLNHMYSLNPKYSSEGRDKFNRRLYGAVSAPVLADLDKDGSLEIICAALDNHIYVWKANGEILPGWPVLVIDESKFYWEDVSTHKIVPFEPDSTYFTGKIVSTPAVGDINNDGYPEIIVGTTEQYDEQMNVTLSDGLIGMMGKLRLMGGNTRLHALHHDGDHHSEGPYVEGWPVKIALLEPELLPYVGSGISGSPALADVNGDGYLEIAVFSAAGPMYLLNGDGTSYYGHDLSGNYRAMDMGSLLNPNYDMPTIPALGSPIFADITGSGHVSCIAPSAGLKRLADVLLPADQLGDENHITAWDPSTGKILPGFPMYMDDLQFLTSPTVADIDGDGTPEILEGSGGFILRAYNAKGETPAGWPKFTGKWIISSPAFGDIDGDGMLEVAVMTRMGDLYVWDTSAPACGSFNNQWRTFHHDTWHTGLYGMDTIPPGRPLDFKAIKRDDHVIFSWTGIGDDGMCREVSYYEIRGYNGDITKNWEDATLLKIITKPQGAGKHVEIEMEDSGFEAYGIQAKDGAGNLSKMVATYLEGGTGGGEETPPAFLEDHDKWYECFIATAILPVSTLNVWIIGLLALMAVITDLWGSRR
ncbi:MAG: FG-GAP-like repeat-containing protein [Thermodesulfobacteriota bacterium]|nr:FG-GAP-like repeat-containing protein [Thermodesulfobacteriota bacterium]